MPKLARFSWIINTAVEREKAETTFNGTSEYKIGHTTYLVQTIFNPVSQESISDILKRLIIRESEKFLGESGQEPEKQAV
ncbi:MAG: transposon-encoded TnpW family protein [Hominimerdicola sp.]